jgi:hypothetical protein
MMRRGVCELQGDDLRRPDKAKMCKGWQEGGEAIQVRKRQRKTRDDGTFK